MSKNKRYSFITKALFVMGTCLLCLLIFIGINERFKLAVQYDYSVNFILGLLDKKDNVIEKDQYVAFFFKAVNNERYGKHFVKKVACLGGEYLKNKGRDFYCGEKYIGTAKLFDKQGNPAGLFEYSGKIEESKLFVIGETRDSYDSKYWGFVDKHWIRGRVYKII